MAPSWNKLHRACITIDTHKDRSTLLMELKKIEMMCKFSYSVDAPTAAGNTPLHLACTQACPDLVRLLLSLGADPEAENDSLETPLHHSLMHGRAEIVTLILNQSVDVNVDDKNGCTPLHWALQQMDINTDILHLLINAGADLLIMDVNGDTPLHYAAREGYVEAVSILVAAGANLRAANHDGLTPFHTACSVDAEEVVNAMLTMDGCDPLQKTKLHNLSALHIAARSGSAAVFDTLIDAGFGECDAVDAYGRTPLHIAAKVGDEYIADKLVSLGANCTLADTFDKTPSMYAKGGNHVALLPLLGASKA